jgi:Domain of unknown function (DUF1330)
MPAYVVITKTRTRNPAELALYAKEAPAFMAGHAATFLARFGACETVEGAAAEGEGAAAAHQWALVVQLAGELEARRRARVSVVDLAAERAA